MNRIISLLILLLSCLNLSAQNLTKNDFFGSWNVEKVTLASSNPDYAPITEGFSKATFIFKESGDFEFINNSDAEIFKQVSGMFTSVRWEFDTEHQLIKIGTDDDKFSRLGIYTHKVDGAMHFHLKESGLKFQMKKLEN